MKGFLRVCLSTPRRRSSSSRLSPTMEYWDACDRRLRWRSRWCKSPKKSLTVMLGVKRTMSARCYKGWRRNLTSEWNSIGNPFSIRRTFRLTKVLALLNRMDKAYYFTKFCGLCDLPSRIILGEISPIFKVRPTDTPITKRHHILGPKVKTCTARIFLAFQLYSWSLALLSISFSTYAVYFVFFQRSDEA